jgi:hypothetical protein
MDASEGDIVKDKRKDDARPCGHHAAESYVPVIPSMRRSRLKYDAINNLEEACIVMSKELKEVNRAQE